MREYELSVVFDLAFAEADGQDAGPNAITTLVEARQGSVVRVDHWGRRRMAYPIKGMQDADYVITRIMLDPTQVREVETALKLNERVLRHLVVRADEMPVPRQREEPPAPPPPAAVAVAEAAPVAAESGVASEAETVVMEAAAIVETAMEEAAEAVSELGEDESPEGETSTTA